MQFQWGSKKVDPCHAQYNSKEDPLKMILLRGSEPEGLQDPALSAPAVLRRRGNQIHRSKAATEQDHYHQRELGKYLPHLTVWWSPVQKILPKISAWKMPKKHVSHQSASGDIPEYLLPPHPSERNSQHRPPPPSSYCWRYSRWPCHSRPCVPSGILSCPQ